MAATVVFFAATLVVMRYNIKLPLPDMDWVSASAPTVHDVSGLSVLPKVLYYGWTFVSRSFFVFVSLHIILFFSNSLPKDRFVENAMNTATYCAPFIAVELIRILGALTYGLDPARGPLFYVLGNAVQSLALVFIAFELLDESVTACVYFIGAVACMVVFAPILNGLVFQSLSAL